MLVAYRAGVFLELHPVAFPAQLGEALKLFFQAEDGIRDRSPSRGLGDVYKRQAIGVDQGQSRESKMSALKIIRKHAKKAINLEAARNLMARRQLAGA